MNIRLFSVVLTAVGSLALAACTVTTTDGSGGSGGSGGDPTTGSGSTSNSSSAGVGGMGTGGMGTGGMPACQTCGEVITPPDGDLNLICATSSDIFNALNECVCGGGGMMGACEAECTDSTMACFAWGMLPDPCIMCRTAMCGNETDACANDLP